MKRFMKRMLLVMLVCVLAAGVVLPTAMAAEGQVVSNAASTSIYAGMKSTLSVSIRGVKQKASLYRWTSSNSSVVSVTSSGVITGMKAGYSATIKATRKSTGVTSSIKVTVKKNKVDNINSKPSISKVTYKKGGIALKSVEIASPSKVVVEYYVVFNFPSNWRATTIVSVQDAINLYNRSSGAFYKTIVGDSKQVTSKKISGFKAKTGRSVQVIKVTYSGSRVHASNIRLSNYRIASSRNAFATYGCRKY